MNRRHQSHPHRDSHAGKPAAKAAAMPEKCAFPGAQLPGGTQKHDRSGGVKRCPVYPESKGI